VTLEVSNTTPLPARIYAGEGIAQFLFFESDEPCETSYADKKGSTRRSVASPFRGCSGGASGSMRRREKGPMVHETITLEGHLIDSDIMRRVFDRVVEEGGEFEVQEFRVGRTNEQPSFARIEIRASEPAALDRILEAVRYLGATTEVGDCAFAPAERTASCPTSSTRRPTSTPSCGSTAGGSRRATRRWTPPRPARRRAALREAGAGEEGEGVALRAPHPRAAPRAERDYALFGFMSNDVSAEINKGIVIRAAAKEMRRVRAAGSGSWWSPGRGGALGRRGGPRGARARGLGDVISPGTPSPCTTSRRRSGTSLGVCQNERRAVEGAAGTTSSPSTP